MRSGRSSRVAGALVGGAALLLYLATLSHWYSADGLLFAGAVDATDWRERVDPYHLLLHPLAWLWVKAWLLAGWTRKSIVPLQVLNAAGGATAVGLLFVLVADASGSRRSALLAAVGFACSGGTWMYSTEAEDVAMALPAFVGLGAVLLGLAPGGPRRPAGAVLLGFAIGVAAVLYLTLAFLLIPAALVLLESGEGRARRVAWLGLGFLLPTLPAVLFVTHVEVGLAEWPRMLSLHGGRGNYGRGDWMSLPRGFYAFLRMFLVFPGLGINDSTMSLWARSTKAGHAALVATYLAVAVVAVAPIVLALRGGSAWDARLRRRALAWVAPFALFALYWVPSDQEFWLPVAVGWFALAGVLVGRGRVPTVTAAAIVLFLLIGNAFCVILPHRDASRNALIASTRALVAGASPSDVFVTRPPQRLYLAYFGERDALAVEEGGDVDAAVAVARERAGASAGRVLVFDLPMTATNRERWAASPAFEVGGETVWVVR